MEGSYDLPVSARTVAELTKTAAELRRMAATATTQDVMNSLLRLAERYETVARQRG
jgi:hypothetical protein